MRNVSDRIRIDSQPGIFMFFLDTCAYAEIEYYAARYGDNTAFRGCNGDSERLNFKTDACCTDFDGPFSRAI